MIQSIRGTKDIFAESVILWRYLENIFHVVSEKYGYQELRTPIFEKTEVFSRGIGEATDIVNKEMYTFIDKGGDSITLRPEMTAALVRSVIQHSLLQANPLLRLYYYGPFFRYERPQKGRLREFHQYGAECIGTPYPEGDVEVIHLANDIISSTGVKNSKLLLNTLGNDEVRIKYKKELLRYLNSHKSSLSSESQLRLEYNPLRVLDSKESKDQEIIDNAPTVLDFLDKESFEHFETVKNQLKSTNLNYEIQPRLVRGLDYYCHTVFEFQNSWLGSQDSIGGGGRYNSLFEQLGGKNTPAVGFALGVERILLILESMNFQPDNKNKVDIYIISTDNSQFVIAQNIANELRQKDLNVIIDVQRRSLKSQLREANKINTKYTIILGEDELTRNSVILKNMQNGEQQEIPLKQLNNFFND
jgi:histidyl-tRNA synthetase